MQQPQLISSLISAITRQEGATNLTYNNPGNLMDLPYYSQTGKFRLAQYSTPEEGQAALAKTLQSYINQGVTLEELFTKYAPSGHGGNDPVTYAKNVSQWTGIPLGQPLNTISAGANATPVAGGVLDSLFTYTPVTADASTPTDVPVDVAGIGGDTTGTTIAILLAAAVSIYGVVEIFS